MIRKWLTDLIVGKSNARHLSEVDFKNVILRGHLAMVGFSVGIAYIFIDHWNGIRGNEGYYIATCIASVVTLYFNRIGKYKIATILFLSLLNFIVFLFSASDTYRSGVYIFFVVTSLTSFALFGYKDRRVALFFAALSLFLFLYSYLGDHGILPKRTFNETYLQINFTTNFIVALITSIAIVYFLIDVNFHSERQILAKNAQLAKANAELDRFVYSASHDLRAPLSSILGLVEVFHLSQDETERKKVVSLIQARANKLDEFIQEILDYSRNSRVEIKSQSVNGLALVQEIIEGLRYSKNFEKILIDIDAQSDCTVRTDPERLKVILNNLLANALKYHDADKSQPFVRITFTKSKAFWSVTVEDNGIGIGSDHHPRIFDMFYRAHESSEGSGLGLYIVKEAAERMGGSVSMKSELGLGSVFTVEFPERNLQSVFETSRA
jgi:signal transduction histidine kinase